MINCITFGRNEFKQEKFKPCVNDMCRNKPRCGGFWASTLLPETENYSAWAKWGICEDFLLERLNQAVVFALSPKAKIYEINSVQDLTTLLDKYSHPALVGRQIDFEKLSKVYDAIHLTERGQIATRMSYPDDLYGWDVESYLIMNPYIVVDPKEIKLEREWWRKNDYKEI